MSRKSNIGRISVVGLMVLVFSGFSQISFGELHEFYRQNGDCYLLIGDGPKRGVYALNNLTGGSTELLYDPSLAYGLSAGLRMEGATIKKNLYTFTADAAGGWTPVTGNISRRVIVWPNATTVFGRNSSDPSGAPNAIVHRAHNDPGGSSTGRGNHTTTDYMSSLTNVFGGTCYPCSIIPTDTPDRPGYYEVPVGKWYHALDWPVWSPYTYLGYGTTYTGWYNGRYYYQNVGVYTEAGGWAHYVVRENVQAQFTTLKLMDYDRTAKTGPSLKKTLDPVKTAEKASLDKRGECVDGCISAADNVELPGRPTPYLDTVYSALMAKAYVYSRTPGETAYKLDGFVTGKDVLVGDPASATSIGVSSKNTDENYVYALGKDVINQWLTDAHSPDAMKLNELTDIAVSDQWWQTGGIVYAYDKTKGKVTKFVRKEADASPPPPEEILVDDGISLPDSIGCDGFGNLYTVKTNFAPSNPDTDFTPNDAYKYESIWPAGNKFRGYFKQRVSKSVFKRDYYSGNFTKISGQVDLGDNEFIRDFTTTTPSNKATWVWYDAHFTKLAPSVETAYKTELAVINSATPPVVSTKSGVTDIRGPLLQDPPDTGPLTAALPEADGKYRDDTTYLFDVENAPFFDANGVNIGSTDEDKDGDGRIGSFPTTVEEKTLGYYWKILQTKDRYDKDVSNTILNQEADGASSTSSILPVMLPGGEYRIGVKSQFKYYDYDKLTPGDLAASKSSALSDFVIGIGEDVASYSWVTFKVKTVPDVICPEGRGVIMSGKYVGSDYVYRPISPNDNGTSYCDNSLENPPNPKFVVKENASLWSFKLRESNYNTSRNKNRIASMADTPPDPMDPRMEPGSLEWIEDAPQYTWSANLNRGTEGIVARTVNTTSSAITMSDIKTLLPVPSQPASYSFSVKGIRNYKYRTQIGVPQVVGEKVITVYKPLDKFKKIFIYAEAEVYITDETPPLLSYTDPFGVPDAKSTAFFISNDLLYGTTGETLANTESSPVANPDYLQFVVADNNPFGNVSGSTVTDQFHGDSTHHNVNDRIGSFSYTTKPGLIPVPGDSTMEANYRSGSGKVAYQDLEETSFKAISWIPTPETNYNKAFSYRLYKIARDDLTHFSETETGAFIPNMALNLANSSPGYSNLLFGLGWRESSGLGTAPYRVGGIVIRDNDRPNAFVEVIEQKHPEMKFYSPSNVFPSKFLSGWTLFASGFTTDAMFNGISSWNSDNIGGFDTAFRINAGTPITNLFSTGDSTLSPLELETDVPVNIKPYFSDNVGIPVISEFGIRDKDGAKITEIPDTTGETIAYLFRNSGNFQVVLKIKDNALGWPSDPRNAPTVADSLTNERVLSCPFSVFATRLEVRILDRSSQGK